MGRLQIWPGRDRPLTFLRGMNTFRAPNELPLDAWVLLQNFDLNQEGGASGRYGYEAYGGVLGNGADLGAHELVRNDDTRYLLRIGADGKLYKRNASTWTNIPIRLASPYGVTATNGASGSVGANLAGNTKYQYAFVAVDATGKTLDSTNIDSDSGEVTTGATPYPITATAKGVYAAVTYEVWRRTYSGGSWGSWGRMATGLTHSTADGKTTVTYTDDGNTAPDTGQTIPASNTTDYTLPTDQRADWITARKSGNNVAFFVNGAGICWTDGTTAQIIQPAITNPSGDALTDNKLWDVTDDLWTCRGIHELHTHPFLCDAPNRPNRFYFGDADRGWDSFPQNGFVVDPFANGGRVLDFRTFHDALVVGLTTGIDVLWGRQFDTTSLSDGTVYFSHADDNGIASEWSMTRGPQGTLIYLDARGRFRHVLALSPVKEQVRIDELPGGQAIRPTLAALTDWENATAVWDGEQYICAFPADKQVVRIYFFDTAQGRIDAPVVDAMADGLNGWLRLKDGTLLASDDDTGQLWEMYKSGVLTDNGTAVTNKVLSGSWGLGYDIYAKEIYTLYLVLDVGDGFSLAANVYVGNAQSASTTVSTTVAGADGYAEAEDSEDGAEYDDAVYSRQTPVVKEVGIGTSGHFCQVELTNDSASERPILYGLYFEHIPERRPSGEV